MSLESWKKQLEEFLKQQKFKDCNVVVMPDFFLDRLINLDLDTEDFFRLVADVAKRKGGSLDGISQADIKGGNAINVASALASLGVKVAPIVCTSEYGLQQIKYHFRNKPIDISRIKACGKASITTALEFKTPNGKTNVMLRDLGALADFGPDSLDENDYEAIEEADYTCLFNWAGTLHWGTALAEAVFERAKLGHGKAYYDTADPNPNAQAMAALVERVLKTSKVDILSVNENEAVTYASLLDPSLKEKLNLLDFTELAMEAARFLVKHFPARIDLHTTTFSATLSGTREVVVPTFKVKVNRATGAGDAWNAGNILADHNELCDECRLMLANAVSACYLSSADGMHPTKEKLLGFIKANPLV
ncbi:MAG: carbohydrate kinase family protein [Candidatus Bathyarchaeota archaeon]|nr:carbohydrate kinase family protein [Candidatus Bathyarchaeota archaeon]